MLQFISSPPVTYLLIAETVTAVLCAVYAVQTIYRLTLHPLAHFPGPKLAAVTDLYWAYHDVWYKGGGEMLRQLEYLHSIYGPVVRMAPNTLHFSDPQAYMDIYRMGSDLRKHEGLYSSFDVDQASVGFIDPKQHKIRRELLNPMFQPKAIAQLEYVLQEKVDSFISHLKSSAGTGSPVNLQYGFRAITLDIITAYCFGQSTSCLEVPDFKHPFIMNMTTQIAGPWRLRWIPFALTVFKHTPTRVAYALLPSIRPLLHIHEDLTARINNFRSHPEKLKELEHDIIFTHLMRPDQEELPLSKTTLLQEAQTVVLAGSETVAYTCYTGFFFALANHSILSKLRRELDEAWPDKEQTVSFQVLEELPYLTAFIKECLRMGVAVPTPLERVPTKPLTIAGVHVPANSVVSIGASFVHFNPDIFEDPHAFNPDRWLDSKEGTSSDSLDTWLVPFSRGSRNCLGLHLAWAELYLIMGNIIRKLDLEIYNTSMKDILEVKHYFTPLHEGNAFHVLVKGVRE